MSYHFEFENFTFNYPLHPEPDLKNVKLGIKRGEFITICGGSGSGKTTLVRHLKPSLTPHGEKSGQILFNEKPISELKEREEASKIGFVLQNPESQIVTDKVWHELAFGLENLGYSNQEIRLRVAEMSSFFGIQNWFYKNVNELSGGQKQLLNLAAIMAMQPETIILDEPTSQLDPIGAANFLETVKKINRELAVTVIMTEHRLQEILPMSDRVVVMEKGAIIANDTPQNVAKKLDEMGHYMFEAMPIPMQIISKITKNTYPLTIREGRRAIEECLREKKIIYSKIGAKKEELKKETIIEFKEVFFKYEKNQKDIIKNLSFSVNKGEFYAILGGNGTGKTTTLNLINGIYKPHHGRVIVREKEVATLPQNPEALFVKKTVCEDLKEVGTLKKLSKEERIKAVQSVAETVEIIELLERHPYDLSGGEQQRAALAKVLLMRPKILLLDEPTKGLDEHFKTKLAQILKKLREQGLTILMVSHDIEFCAKYAEICSLFFDGSMITQNETRKFFSGNNFYTTSSNRMVREVFPNAITVKDVLELWQENL